MSTGMLTPEENSPAATTKPPRRLACVQCQQRKIKCNRKLPCANCIRVSVQCVSATAPRNRRRRFPERELLDRLRHYESLLHQNNIHFRPLHPVATVNISQHKDNKISNSPDEAHSECSVFAINKPQTETVHETRNLWHAMNQKSRDQDNSDSNDDDADEDDNSSFPFDDLREAIVSKTWDQQRESNNDLLFGSSKTNIDLSTLHPTHNQIFRLWQTYLDNVNPLLKVTHTPTLQARIIDALGNLATISPVLEALLFSIEDECLALFGISRVNLLNNYQFGCQQALLRCGFLRSTDRGSLTALYLYLISIRETIDPRSLSALLGTAIRIAQRMNIQNESTNAKFTTFEAEIRRRLWWSLVLFDNRISEMVDCKITTLAPTWDCKTLLNVNDFDLRPENKMPPRTREKPTEALFAVVRSELGNFARHSAFHLDFINPSLKTVARNTQHGLVQESEELIALEKKIQDKYLAFCDAENPLHFMTAWTTRGYLAKIRLAEYISKYSTSSIQPTNAQLDSVNSHALVMLESDTKLLTSSVTKGFQWLVQFNHFPFHAYVQLLQDLRQRPTQKLADEAWRAMSDNYEARVLNMDPERLLFLRVFSKAVPQAWEARKRISLISSDNKPLERPKIVSDIEQKLTEMTPITQASHNEAQSLAMSIDIFSNSVPMDFPFEMDEQIALNSIPDLHNDIPGQAEINFDVNQLDWTTMYSNLMNIRGW